MYYHQLMENLFKKKILFITATKNVRYRGTNLTKIGNKNHFYNEKFKTLLKN